ncbi:Cell division control protein 2, partial [Nowakowskiella sp. JEL0078]
VQSLYYRSPEILLGGLKYESPELVTNRAHRLGAYSSAIDIWSVGCILAELLKKKKLFKGETEIEILVDMS